MRTLTSALLNAVNALTRRPAFTLTIEDHVIHYGPYHTPATADAWNDACIANDNSIIRVHVTRGGSGFVSNFQVQRITDPAQAAQWANWSTLPGSAGLMFQDGGCAVSNSGGTLRAFAQQITGGSALRVWTSIDNGVSWTGPVSALTPPGGALLKGIGSAGNNDVFFLYDVAGGVAMGSSFFSSGSWSAINVWTLPAISFGMGVAPVWTGSQYVLIYSNGYTLSSCTFNPTTLTWSNSSVLAPSTNTAIGRISPRVSFADNLYTLTCIELDNGLLTGSVYSYPRLRQSADLVHWSNGSIQPDVTSTYGAIALKLPAPQSGSSGPRYYLATLATVYSAPAFQSSSPTHYLDVSASILSYRRFEQVGRPARLEIELDNAQGVYNALVSTPASFQPIGMNATLILKEGYKTGSPPSTDTVIRVGTYHIQEIRFERSPYENRLHLLALDLSHRLDMISRYQTAYNNQTLAYLITEVCARAGLFSVAFPATSQMNQPIPSFVLLAAHTYRHALDELCATYGLSYFLDQSEIMQFRELSSGDLPIWNYASEIEFVNFKQSAQQANHIIVSGKPPLSTFSSLTTAEVHHLPHLRQTGFEHLLYHVDPKLGSVAQCNQKATLLMAQEIRTGDIHSVWLPLNPALQLLDSITLTDSAAPVGSGQQVTCRITELQAHYDAQLARNELHLTCSGL